MKPDYETFHFGIFPRKKGVIIFLKPDLEASGLKKDGVAKLLPLEIIHDEETELVVVAVQSVAACQPKPYFDLLSAIKVRSGQRLALSFYDDEWNRTSEYHFRNGHWLEGSREYVLRRADHRGADVKLQTKAGNLQSLTLIRKPNYAVALLGIAVLAASVTTFYLFFIAGSASIWSSLILVPLALLCAGVGALLYCLRKCVTRCTAGDNHLTHEVRFLGYCRLEQIAAAQIRQIVVEQHRSASDAGRERPSPHFMVLLVLDSHATVCVASARNAHAAMGKANLLSDLLDIPVETRSADGEWKPNLRQMGSDCDIPERWCPSFLLRTIGQ